MRRTILGIFAGCVLLVGFVRLDGQDQHPILDQVANKVIAKYQNATCQQLWMERAAHTPPTPEQQSAIQYLQNNPPMRALFLNKVASPIANKLFECGMIP